MNKKIVVLDLNGILADIRRREAPVVRSRMPDVVLPNGQKAYLHPRAGDFLRWLSNLNDSVDVITYTSRLRRNAEPVESLLTSLMKGNPTVQRPNNHHRHAPLFMAKLHGEDCKPAGTNRDDPFHPVKTLDAVMRAVSAARHQIAMENTLPPLVIPRSSSQSNLSDIYKMSGIMNKPIRDEDVIFVDDHPHRIESGAALVIQAGRYDASNDAETVGHLSAAVRCIQSALGCEGVVTPVAVFQQKKMECRENPKEEKL